MLEKIAEMYFDQKVKSFKIACASKISRNKVYKEVEQIKKFLISTLYEIEPRVSQKRRIRDDVKQLIYEFLNKRANTYFTINDIIKHLSYTYDYNEIPSRTYI